jgi:hypothetical protein
MVEQPVRLRVTREARKVESVTDPTTCARYATKGVYHHARFLNNVRVK